MVKYHRFVKNLKLYIEMQICNIGKYVIDKITPGELFLMKNRETQGELSKNIAK